MLRLFGVIGLACVQAPVAKASLSPEREALEARVEAARRLLQQHEAPPPAEAGSPVAQWGNWPNWGNWGNWPNWGNWRNF